MPYKSANHQTVVCQESVIHVGGYDWGQGKVSSLISVLKLTSPCIMKELYNIRKQRWCHGAEVFEDKVLILGGEVSGHVTTGSVLEFHRKSNSSKKVQKLPYPLIKANGNSSLEG